MLTRVLSLSILAFVAALSLFSAPAHADAEHFARPPELEPDIAFWRRIYTEVTTENGVLHDPENLSVIYEVIKFPSDLSPETAIEADRRSEEALRAHPRTPGERRRRTERRGTARQGLVAERDARLALRTGG